MPRSLLWATMIDVLPPDRVVERRDGYIAVRSPSNPTHYWGNFLVFDAPPGPGDADAWEATFTAEFADEPRIRHRLFGWDETTGELGAAREEFVADGYLLDESVALVAGPGELEPHPRENREIEIRALAADGDEELWRSVLELQVANRDQRHDDEARYRAYITRRLADLRALFRAGRGSWYAALTPAGEVAACCGIVVTEGRGRYQAVDTAVPHRRRGIASRLLVEAARHAEAHHGARQLVIVADANYHALDLYESLGFARREHTFAVWRLPDREE